MNNLDSMGYVFSVVTTYLCCRYSHTRRTVSPKARVLWAGTRGRSKESQVSLGQIQCQQTRMSVFALSLYLLHRSELWAVVFWSLVCSVIS